MTGAGTHTGVRRRRWPWLLAAVCGLVLYFGLDRLRDLGVNDLRYSCEIAESARKYGLDPQLVRAVVFQESRFRPDVRGAAGEVGLMQLMPGAVADYARAMKSKMPHSFELFRPAVNLEIGCWYLAQAVRKYRHYKYGTELALCQYNAGAARSDAWKPERPDGTVIDRISIPGTRTYVNRIIGRYHRYVRENRPYPPAGARKEKP